MAVPIAELTIELAAGHPDTGAYSLVDLIAADELNDLNRPAVGGVIGMVEYLSQNRSRTNDGTDTTATAILGRLQSVDEGAVGANPFGSVGLTLTMEHIHAAKMFMKLLDSPQVSTFDFINTEVTAMMDKLSGGAGNAKVWKTADVTALKALSQNQQSRASELGWGKVFEGHIQKARA